MSKSRSVSLLAWLPLVAALALAAMAARPNPFLGRWHGTSRGDQWQDFTLVLQAAPAGSAEAFTGSISLEDGTELPLSQIRIHGNRIAFQLDSPDGDTYTITGRLSHHRLRGKYHSANSSGTWKATRVHASPPSPAP